MATEKYFVFSESGQLKRMKGRIVRFLDNEDPSGSDKSAIRTSLEVSPDAAGLVQADIGTAPNEIPVNGMLGDMAYQSSEGISVARAEVESTTGTATTEAFKVTDGTDTNLVVREDGKVGLGGTPTVQLEVFNNSSAIMRLSAGTNASAALRLKNDAHEWDVNCQTNDNFAIYSHTSAAERLVVNASSGDVTIGQGNVVMGTSGKGIDFGSGSTLSDYEEGTHTATLTPSSSGTITLNSSNDTIGYTRVGDLVTVTGALVLSSVSSPVGNYIEMSLPFSIATLGDSAGSFTGAAIVFGAAGNSGDYSWLGVSGGSAARLYKTTGVYAVATAADFSGDEDIYVNFTYHTTD